VRPRLPRSRRCPDSSACHRLRSSSSGRSDYSSLLLKCHGPAADIRVTCTLQILGGVMKKLFFTVAFSALIAAPAMAADLARPVYRRPVVVPRRSIAGRGSISAATSAVHGAPLTTLQIRGALPLRLTQRSATCHQVRLRQMVSR